MVTACEFDLRSTVRPVGHALGPTLALPADETAKLTRVREVIETLTGTGQRVTGRTLAEHVGTYLRKVAEA